MKLRIRRAFSTAKVASISSATCSAGVLTTLCRTSSRIPTFRPSSGCGSAGADTSPSQPSPAIPRHRSSRHLRMSAGPARPLLVAMLPYLIIKKSQVEIALEFIEAKSCNRGRRGDPVALAKRAALAARMPRPRARFNVVNQRFSERETEDEASETCC